MSGDRWSRLAKRDHPIWRQPLRGAARIVSSLVRIRIGHNPPTVQLGAGIRIIADLGTPLGLSLYRYRPYLDPDLELIRTYLASGDVFIDGGSNIGLYSLVAASCVGEKGHVFAFEPAPAVRVSALRNIATSGFPQVNVLPYALSEAAAWASFHVAPLGGGTSSLVPDKPSGSSAESKESTAALRVMTARLDDVVPRALWPRVAMVKLDIEGAEVAALRGAVDMLQTAHPVLLLEVAEGNLAMQGSCADELLDLLSGLGYQAVAGAAAEPNVLFVFTVD